ncbi:MAG TPA: hypothetical protein PLU35_13810 [Phycisphaerales bacterium]|nr:hypothetical protein [Phycisphaerales bacterium]
MATRVEDADLRLLIDLCELEGWSGVRRRMADLADDWIRAAIRHRQGSCRPLGVVALQLEDARTVPALAVHVVRPRRDDLPHREAVLLGWIDADDGLAAGDLESDAGLTYLITGWPVPTDSPSPSASADPRVRFRPCPARFRGP